MLGALLALPEFDSLILILYTQFASSFGIFVAEMVAFQDKFLESAYLKLTQTSGQISADSNSESQLFEINLNKGDWR